MHISAVRPWASFALPCLLVCAIAIMFIAAGSRAAAAAEEHEYHLWDVLTSRAADCISPVEGSASAMMHKAQRGASRAVSYVLGSQPVVEPRTRMARLGDLVGALGRGVSPSWPEAVFESTRDPAFTKYIHELGHASKQAHSQIRSKLDAHSQILQEVVHAHQSVQLPLASRFVPLLALLVACAASGIRTRMPQRGPPASPRSGRGAARVVKQAVDLSEAMTSCVHLALIPMAVVQLAVMELSGCEEWILVAGYCTLLAATTAAAAQHSMLACVVGTDNVARLARAATVGTMVVAGAYCFVPSAFG